MSYEEELIVDLTAISGGGNVGCTFSISAQVSIQTQVLGEARNIAAVSILSGSVTLWSATLTQFVPTAVTPYKIVGGDATIEKGAEFTLTIPTPTQIGQVVFTGEVASGNNPPTPITSQVCNWTLSGGS